VGRECACVCEGGDGWGVRVRLLTSWHRLAGDTQSNSTQPNSTRAESTSQLSSFLPSSAHITAIYSAPYIHMHICTYLYMAYVRLIQRAAEERRHPSLSISLLNKQYAGCVTTST